MQKPSNCINKLKSDHQKILAQLDDLEKVIKQPNINYEKIEEFLEFTENFAEPHHHKEEQVLFPALEKKGMSNEGGPIGMMLLEHTIKREYLEKMRDCLQKKNKTKLKENTQEMIYLLRNHIDKENDILYPCAEDMLSQKELENLALKCEKIKK